MFCQSPDHPDESDPPMAVSVAANSVAGRQRNAGRVAIGLVALFVFLSIAYVVATAKWRWDEAMTGLSPTEHGSYVFRWCLRSALTEVFVIWWILAVSGTIGSFLNVVVYRMPRGLSLSGTGSSCVCCGTRIKWYDNQPVVGWLLLQGRCRSCHEPISSRYPLVEFLAVILGLGLFLLTVQTTLLGPAVGRAAPSLPDVWYYFWLLQPLPAQRLLNFFYLLPPLMACLAIAWASYDNTRLPMRFYLGTGLLCASGAALYQLWLGAKFTEWYGRHEWSEIEFLSPSVDLLITRLMEERVLGWFGSSPANGAPDWATLILGQSLGMAFGLLFGWTLAATARWFVAESQSTVLSQSTSIFALLGVVGGWYLPLAIGVLWFLELAIRRCGQRFQSSPPPRPQPLLFLLPYYYLVSIAVWRWFP
ncbi:MAG: prepilin peptidase [Planctomycetaceae bacterium]|nr:prepilin peptidase [Planctomycetaceae bacterium]